MKAIDIRRRLGRRLQEAAMEKDPDALAFALDYGRAILLALAPLAEDDEVDLSEMTVSTAIAARILRFHVEYVRELIRRGVLTGAKHNNEYEIGLTDLMEFMSSSRYQAVGTPGAAFRAALRRFPDIWGMTIWRRSEEEHGFAL